MAKESCPPPDQLSQFLLGQLPEPQAEDLAQHLSECDPCLRTVESLRVEDTLLQELQHGVGVARQAAQAVQQGLMERVQALAPPGKPHDLKEAPTPPPDNQPTPGPVVGGALPARPAGRFDFLALAQAPDEIGRLGHYRVLKVLGQGGMGVVFRAEDVRLGRPVALKAMLPEVAQEPDARERFLREARAVAALDHDNIVAIHHVDEDRGVPYIIMPLLKGMSLEDWLNQEQQGVEGAPLKLAQILKIGREIATGLAAAHERGLIHRDIKPANIWLEGTAGDRVKLLDFGLARSTSGDQKLTRSGSILGTPAYMAPEQAQGHKVDGRADLFSLGVVLYRLCTGTLPFHGPDMISMMMALATHEPPPPQALNPCLPGRLSDLVIKLLAKEPAQRLGSAEEAVKELVAIEKDQAPPSPASDPQGRETLTVPPPPAPAWPASVPPDPTKVAAPARRRRRRWPIAAACLALVLVPLGIYLAPTVIRVNTDEGTLVIDVNDADVLVTVKQDNVKLYDKVRDRTFTVTAGKGLVEVYEKDGVGPLKTETFTLNRGDTETVHVRLKPRVPQVDAKEGGTSAKSADKAVENIQGPLDTNMVLPILRGHTAAVTSVAFSYDGKRLASASEDKTVKLWDVTTSHCMFTLQGHTKAVTSVAFSPDGKRLASGSEDRTVMVWDAKTGEDTLILTAGKGPVSVAFSPDGKRLARGYESDLSVVPWGTVQFSDATTGRDTLALAGHTKAVTSIAFSPDGKRLVGGSGGVFDSKYGKIIPGGVKIWDATTGKETLTLTGYTNVFTSVAFSPDGKRVVTGSGERVVSRGGLSTELKPLSGEVKVWDATTGQGILTLKGPTELVTSVAFSPDGKRLVSCAARTVKVWDATTGQEILSFNKAHPIGVNSVVFSPDGKRLASGGGDGSVRLWDVDR